MTSFAEVKEMFDMFYNNNRDKICLRLSESNEKSISINLDNLPIAEYEKRNIKCENNHLLLCLFNGEGAKYSILCDDYLSQSIAISWIEVMTDKEAFPLFEKYKSVIVAVGNVVKRAPLEELLL